MTYPDTLTSREQEAFERQALRIKARAEAAEWKSKITAYVSALRAVPVPEIKTEDGLKVMEAITGLMTKLETYALGQIETL